MKEHGLIYKINDVVYLSLIDPKINKCTDGIPINERPYENLTPNEIMFSEIIITDGTEEIDMEVSEFLEVCMDFDDGVIFYNIKDLMSYEYKKTIAEINNEGRFEIVSDNIIKDMIKK